LLSTRRYAAFRNNRLQKLQQSILAQRGAARNLRPTPYPQCFATAMQASWPPLTSAPRNSVATTLRWKIFTSSKCLDSFRSFFLRKPNYVHGPEAKNCFSWVSEADAPLPSHLRKDASYEEETRFQSRLFYSPFLNWFCFLLNRSVSGAGCPGAPG
jgi:hypothetical protein